VGTKFDVKNSQPRQERAYDFAADPRSIQVWDPESVGQGKGRQRATSFEVEGARTCSRRNHVGCWPTICAGPRHHRPPRSACGAPPRLILRDSRGRRAGRLFAIPPVLIIPDAGHRKYTGPMRELRTVLAPGMVGLSGPVARASNRIMGRQARRRRSPSQNGSEQGACATDRVLFEGTCGGYPIRPRGAPLHDGSFRAEAGRNRLGAGSGRRAAASRRSCGPAAAALRTRPAAHPFAATNLRSLPFAEIRSRSPWSTRTPSCPQGTGRGRTSGGAARRLRHGKDLEGTPATAGPISTTSFLRACRRAIRRRSAKKGASSSRAGPGPGVAISPARCCVTRPILVLDEALFGAVMPRNEAVIQEAAPFDRDAGPHAPWILAHACRT